jgi:hypothetical protein
MSDSTTLKSNCYVADRIDRLYTALCLIDWWESRRPRRCTCHPDDNPPRPCPRRYALHECMAAASQQ